MFKEEGISSCGKSWIELQVLTWKNLETVLLKNLDQFAQGFHFYFYFFGSRDLQVILHFEH
jgi:hypothetical protein